MESHLKEHNISSHGRKRIDFCTILKANFIFSNNLINNVEKNHKFSKSELQQLGEFLFLCLFYSSKYLELNTEFLPVFPREYESTPLHT